MCCIFKVQYFPISKILAIINLCPSIPTFNLIKANYLELIISLLNTTHSVLSSSLSCFKFVALFAFPNPALGPSICPSSVHILSWIPPCPPRIHLAKRAQAPLHSFSPWSRQGWSFCGRPYATWGQTLCYLGNVSTSHTVTCTLSLLPLRKEPDCHRGGRADPPS